MPLIAHWPLVKNANEYVTNNKFNNIFNLELSENGKIGSCYNFNGKNSIIQFEYFPLLNLKKFSFSFWIKLSSLNTQNIICSRNSLGKGFAIFYINNQLRFDFGDSNNQWTVPNSSFSINKWYHCTFVVGQGKRKFYLNSVLKAATDNVGKPLEQINKMSIGSSFIGNFTSKDNFLNGSIADLKFYNHILNLNEIINLYESKIVDLDFNYCAEPTINLLKPENIEAHGCHLDKSIINEYKIKTSEPNIMNNFGIRIKKLINENVFTSNKDFTISYDFYLINNPEFLSCYAIIQFDDNSTETIVFSKINNFLIGRELNKWYKFYDTVSLVSDKKIKSIQNFFLYKDKAIENMEMIIKNLQLEQKNHSTEFIPKERKGLVIDKSGYKNNGSIKENSPIYNKNNYYTFDNKQAITMNNILLNDEFSIAIEFDYKNTNYNQRITGDWGQNNELDRWLIFLINDIKKIAFDISLYTSEIYLISNQTIKENTKYYIVATFKNNKMSLYINGKLDSEKIISGQIFTKHSKEQFIGYEDYPDLLPQNEFFKGNIYSYKIYATALSAESILNKYQTKATIDFDKNVNCDQVKEPINILYDVQSKIDNKQGIAFYNQEFVNGSYHDGYIKIFRQPNVGSERTWGGVNIKPPENFIHENKKYLFTFEYRGKSQTGLVNPYLCQQMGWACGNMATNTSKPIKPLVANTNTNDWQLAIYEFDTTNWSPWQTATKDESIFESGKIYNCARDLGIGFNYEPTGELGTDLDLRNFKLIEVTNDNFIDSNGVLYKEIIEQQKIIKLFDYKIIDGKKFGLIFFHDCQSGTQLFSSHKDELLNTNSEFKKSKLGNLESFRDLKGQFEFVLEYNDLPNQYNHWVQTSNPVESIACTGYSPIHIDWTQNKWFGLALTSHGDEKATWIDGSKENNWYYAIGAQQKYLTGMPKNEGPTASWVKLWVKVNDNVQLNKNNQLICNEIREV